VPASPFGHFVKKRKELRELPQRWSAGGGGPVRGGPATGDESAPQ